MSLGLPGHLAPAVVTRAFARAVHVTAYTCIAGAAIVAIAFQLVWPRLPVWPAALTLLPMLAALILLDRLRSQWLAVVYLLAGGVSIYWYGVTFPKLGELDAVSGAVAVSLPMIALIMVGGGNGAAQGFQWCTAGYIIAEIATSAARLQTGRELRFDPATTVTWAVTGAVLLLAYVSERRARRTQPRLHRAARDELVSALRSRIELKAAALLHDTVLSHLAAISSTDSDTLSPALRAQIERDLEVLVGSEWLADDPVAHAASRAEWEQSSLFGVIREVQSAGLEVDVTGDTTSIGRLSAFRADELSKAVKQCLLNVLKHSGTTDAEVAIYASHGEILVMVVDTGEGFSVDQSPPGRLGLRTSVRRRIEDLGGAVQVWSAPGRGTSVVIRVPIVEDVSTGEQPIAKSGGA